MGIRGLILSACVAALSVGSAFAQDNYPSRPVKLIVPFPAGGTTDVAARLVALALEGQLKQTVVVENMVGASGLVGLDACSQAEPDGYTLCFSTETNQVILPAADAKYDADVVRSLTPIGRTSGADFFLTISSKLPSKTVAEFVDYAKQNPGKLSYGSSGVGTNAHFGGEMLNKSAGLDMVHVPYARSGDIVLSVLAGDIGVYVIAWPLLMPQVQADGIRVLASFSDTRPPQLPDVPTMKESGFPDLTLQSWQAVYAPPGLPAELQTKLSDALQAGLEDPKITERFEPLGLLKKPANAEALKQYEQEEAVRWQKRVETTGVRVN